MNDSWITFSCRVLVLYMCSLLQCLGSWGHLNRTKTSLKMIRNTIVYCDDKSELLPWKKCAETISFEFCKSDTVQDFLFIWTLTKCLTAAIIIFCPFFMVKTQNVIIQLLKEYLIFKTSHAPFYKEKERNRKTGAAMTFTDTDSL